MYITYGYRCLVYFIQFGLWFLYLVRMNNNNQIIMASTVKTTRHTLLQATLNQWFDTLLQIAEFRVADPQNLTELHRKIDSFARSFVPIDIDEEDISHYTNNLLIDEVCCNFVELYFTVVVHLCNSYFS